MCPDQIITSRNGEAIRMGLTSRRPPHRLPRVAAWARAPHKSILRPAPIPDCSSVGGTCHSRNGSICFPNQPLEALMPKYPKVEKGFPRLSQDDSLRSTTIQLVTGALLSAGLLLSVTPSAEARSIAAPTLTAPSNQGNAIVLAPSSGMTKPGSTLLAGHSSHSSHASHHSHYSSR